MSIYQMPRDGYDADTLATSSPDKELSTVGRQQTVGHRMTTAQALAGSGLDFRVETEPVFLRDGTVIATHKATVRTDNNTVLGVVGDRYEVVQNHEAFSFLDELVGTAEAVIETAGSFKDGRTVFVQAKLPGSFRVVADDLVDKYLLFASSHDGSLGVSIKFTPIRVVCRNTLMAALTQKENFQVSIRHRASALVRLTCARQALVQADQAAQRAEVLYQFLAAHPVQTQIELDCFWKELVPDPKPTLTGEQPSAGRARAKRDELADMFARSPGNDQPGVRGTWWAAYNAATYLTTHGRNETKRSAAAIAESNWFGAGADFNQRALVLAHRFAAA